MIPILHGYRYFSIENNRGLYNIYHIHIFTGFHIFFPSVIPFLQLFGTIPPGYSFLLFFSHKDYKKQFLPHRIYWYIHILLFFPTT